MYNEYDGKTYYPKYSEDLVHTEVMLPENAPKEYEDASILWNSVEMIEKSSDAQLARTYKVELPNEWSYELATEVMRDYVKRNFVDLGMCAQFAIHDSENEKTGQRNLHCHILLTMRSIDENGKWMAKQKKVYLTDENGERIPIIDKKTGVQKVDKQNRKQWKCKTIDTNDWNSRENAKKWRKDITDTINSVNQKMGMTENFWEYRSFKEQGLDIIPEIHLGEKASALEKAGIQSIRGNINREIRKQNAIILQAKATYTQAKKSLASAKLFSAMAIRKVKNEIIDMIQEVSKRNHDRLKLPVLGTKYLRQVTDRATLQSRERMEQFVHEHELTSFDTLKEYKLTNEQKYNEMQSKREYVSDRMQYLEALLYLYESYEPFIKYHKEQWELKGFARKAYERKHIYELESYDLYRNKIKQSIVEPDKKIAEQKKAAMQEADASEQVENNAEQSENGKEFYTIQTASDKVFYLIIDRDGDEEMVYFLTEISENDLLNTTTDNSETLPKNSAALESAIPVSDSALPNNNTETDTEETEELPEDGEESTEESTEEPEEQPAQTDNPMGTYIVLGIIAVIGIGAGYYFKVVKKKKEQFIDEDDEEDE